MDEFKDFNLTTNRIWKNYEILEKIGQGGMGTVYKAKQKSPQRIVAIKVIQTVSSTSKRRFEREMQIASELDHPNIGKIYNAGIENDQKYLVMDYITGTPLHQYLRKNPLPLMQKLQILLKVCNALDYAHSKEIIHRDLKPENIMVTLEEEPIIIDFGLAKRIDSREFDLTKTGDVIGSPNYMSPEQISGKRSYIDHRTDIYSMGAILYEVICNKRMFEGDSAIEIFFKILHERPTWSCKLNPEQNKSLENIWKKATQRHKKSRYHNVSELTKDLQDFIHGKKIKRSYYREIKVAAVLCLICFISLFYFLCPKQDLTFDITLSPQEQDSQKQLEQILGNIKKHKFAIVKEVDWGKLNITQKLEVAKAFYQQQKYEEAQKILKDLSADLWDVVYYQGLIYYHQKYYQKAQLCFEKLEAQNQEDAKVYYYLGICHLKQDNSDKALSYLLKAKPSFENDTQLLEHIAEIYLKDQKIARAEHYLQRCIELSPRVGKYLVLMGKIQMDKKKYYRAFAYLKKAIPLNSDFAIAKVMHKIPYYEPRLRRLCYQSILHKTALEKDIATPDLFSKKWTTIEDFYRQDYLSWQEGMRNIDKPIINFLKPVIDGEHRKIVKNALLSSRYYKNFDSEIKQAISKKALLAQAPFFRTIQQQAKKRKKQEVAGRIYYQLAFMYRNNSWQKQSLADIESRQILRMLYEENSPFLKYLLIQGHINIWGFQPIITIANGPHADLISKIICCVILRKKYLAAKIDVFQKLENLGRNVYTGEDLEFLQVLLAQAMYVRHQFRVRDTSYRPFDEKSGKSKIADSEKKILFALLNQKSPKVSLCAAINLHSLLGRQQIPNKWQEIENKIFLAMKSSDVISYYAHSMFWGSLVSDETKHYLNQYKLALRHESLFIRQIALSYSERFDRQTMDIMPEIKSCLEHSHPRLRLYAIFSWIFIRKSKNLIFEDSLYKKGTFTPLEHCYIVLIAIYRLLDKQKMSVIPVITHLKQKLHTFPAESQCMISYFLSSLKIHLSLQQLKQTEKKDPRLLAFFLYQLHQEVYPEGLVSLLALLQTTNRDKVSIAKEFIKHKNDKVRMFSVSSYVAFCSEKQRKKMYQQALSSQDISLKKGVALGLYLALQNEWITRAENEQVSLNFKDLLSNQPIDFLISSDFSKLKIFIEKRQKSPKLQRYKEWIKKAIILDPKESLYPFALGFFFAEKSIKNIEDAINLNNYHNAGNYRQIFMLKFLQKLIEKGQEEFASRYLKTQEVSPFLAANMATICLVLKQYPQALKMYEKNFLNKFVDESPFNDGDIFNHHLQMVYIYLKQNDHKTAKIMLEYMYELYRRDVWGSPAGSKEVFLKWVRNKYPGIDIVW